MCVYGSSTRLPALSVGGRGVLPRRSRARSRASRTTNENGFDRKSSAPVSRASASSYSPVLAVSTRIGVQLPDGPQLAGDLVAVHPRQQQVEDDRRVRVLLGAREPVVAVMDDVDAEAFGLQPAGEALGQRHLVLYEEHAHVPMMALAARFPSADR